MQTEARLIIICGLPGSGKTTLARKLESCIPALRMSADDWMLELAINLHDESARTKIEALQWQVTKKLLASGNKVIIEWGSWGRWERDLHRTEARNLGASVELHYLFAPLEELFRRIQQRNMETPPIRWEDVQAWSGVFQPPTIEEMALFDAPLLHEAYEPEESLKGGNTAEFVVRLGATVRKTRNAIHPSRAELCEASTFGRFPSRPRTARNGCSGTAGLGVRPWSLMAQHQRSHSVRLASCWFDDS